MSFCTLPLPAIDLHGGHFSVQHTRIVSSSTFSPDAVSLSHSMSSRYRIPTSRKNCSAHSAHFALAKWYGLVLQAVHPTSIDLRRAKRDKDNGNVWARGFVNTQDYRNKVSDRKQQIIGCHSLISCTTSERLQPHVNFNTLPTQTRCAA